MPKSVLHKAPMRSANATANRAIDILTLFTEKHPVWLASEISAHFRMPRTTTYRYLNSLRGYGLVVEDEDKGFRLGSRVLALARVAKLGLSVVQLALPEMNRLNVLFGETVQLNQRVDEDIVLLHSVESRHSVRLTFTGSTFLPVPAAAVAKVLLAFAPEQVREQLFSRVRPVRYTKRTMRSLAAVRRMVTKVREAGYAINDQEVNDGVRAIAAPLLVGGEAPYALSIIGPVFRLTDDVVPKALRELVKSAAGLSEALVHTGFER